MKATYLHHILKGMTLVVILLSTRLLVFGATEDFAKIAKQTLSEIHAKHFQEGNIKGCVSLYARNAKFFVDNKLNARDRKSTRLNSSHGYISYAVFCLKKKKKQKIQTIQ